MPTPFDAERKIDASGLRHLAKYLLEQDLDGLALLTDAAEDAVLTSDERKFIVETVFAEPRVRDKHVAIRVSEPSPTTAAALVQVCEAKGAQSVIVDLPILPSFGYRELYRYVDRITRKCTLSVALALRPYNAIAMLASEERAELLHHPRVAALYAPHTTSAQVERWIASGTVKDRRVIAGTTSVLAESERRELSGAVSAAALLLGGEAGSLVAARDNADAADVARISRKLGLVEEVLGPELWGEEPEPGRDRTRTRVLAGFKRSWPFFASYRFAAIKEALRMVGHPIRGDVRPPHEGLNADALLRLKAVLKASGALA